MILARIILFIITLIISVVTTTFIFKPKPSTLELVHVIFRHGDRTNDFTTIYPKSPHVNETYYPTGIGELTNDGKRTMYKVGKSLRTRYNEHLGNYYTPGLIEARSSAYSRAKTSLLLVLAGLFPPKLPLQVWNFLLLWQPIPITYKDEEQDPELMGYACQKTEKLLKEYVNSKDYRNKFSKYLNLTKYLSENSGWNVTNMKEVARLYFGLRAESELGLKLPNWAESVYPEPLTDLAPNYYADYTATIELKKYTAGFMLKKIIDDAYAKINGEPSTDSNMMKMHLLSGHDRNCAFMLILLGVFKPHIPPYGAQVIFELHNIDGQFGFRIFYEDFTAINLQPLDLPNCGTFCELDKFKTLHEKYLPDDSMSC